MRCFRACRSPQFPGNQVKGGEREPNALFYLGFALLYVKTMASETTLVVFPDTVDAGLLLASACFLLLHCLKRYADFSRPLLLMLLVAIFLCFNYCSSGLTTPVTAFLFIAAASFGVDKKKFVSIWFAVTGFLFIGLVTFYMLLYLSGSDLAASVIRSTSEGDVVRLSFFFRHPNGAAAVAMMLVGAMLYLRSGKKLKFTHYAFVLLAALLVLYLTDSRTSALLTIALVPLYLIYQNTTFFNYKVVRNAIAVMPIVLIAMVYFLAGPLYSSAVAPMFTGRVWLWHTILVDSGVTLLGREFVPVTAVSYLGSWKAVAYTLDSFYASCLLVMGIVASALFCWAVFRSVRAACGGEIAFLPLIVVLLLHGFTEVGVLTVAISFPIIFLSIAFRTNEGSDINGRGRSGEI